MLKKNTYNFIMSIISTIIIVILMTLIIIFQGIKQNILSLIFIPIISIFLITSNIFDTIFFKIRDEKENIKITLNVLSYAFKITPIVLFAIFLNLFINTTFTWYIFSFVIIIGILNIIFKALGIFSIIRDILNIILLIVLCIIGYLIGNYLLYILFILGCLFYYFIDTISAKLKCNILYSFLGFTIIPIGISLILI